MLQGFRSFFKSKVGIVVTLGFLGLIAFAFASSDIAGTTTFGGVAGGDRVAVVGDARISTSELSVGVSSAMDQMRQESPSLTMEAFLAQGGMEQVLGQILTRTAFAEFARKHGLRASDRLIDSEILQIPAFRGPDGRFDAAIFRQVVGQRGFSEAAVRQDLAQGIYARLTLAPATLSPTVPEGIARRYASLLRERREGAIGVLPSMAYAPQDDPTQEELSGYYTENRARFIRPERRVIRYAAFGESTLADVAAPSEEQIAERFQRDRAEYAATEARRFTQLIVPTQAAADAIAAQVRGGRTLEQAASDQGLVTAAVGPITQADFTSVASAAVAQAGFAGESGALAAPARGGLGWYVLRVDEIDRQPARTLAQVRAEIAETLTQENLRNALSDRTAQIEQEMSRGVSLADIASELGLELVRTQPVTADGRLYDQGGTVPADVAPLVETAFQMEEGDPQIAETVPGQRFVIFDVVDITPSAAAPLAEISDQVAELWRRDEGMRAARQAADRVIARLGEGNSLEQALAAEEIALPSVDRLDITREQVAQAGQVPAVMALFFSMAEGTVKRLEAPGENGWFVVQLDEIDAPQIAQDDPLVAATVQQLSAVAAEEYVSQFAAAVNKEIGVERNQPAIDAVVAQLTGQAN